MFKLNKKTEYAILALQYMMISGTDRVATVKEIAQKYEIPQSLLAKILQKMVKSKIIHSVQGSRGGYTLNKKATQISLLSVLEAIEGPINIVNCTAHHHTCNRIENCTLITGMEPVKQHLSNYFHSLTLADFLAT